MRLAAPELTAPPEVMLPRPFVVTGRRDETPDVVTISLVAADDGPPLEFQPGQFTMMYVPGVGEVPISVSGDPNRPDVLEHTVRIAGAVTRALHRMPVGAAVGIRGPYGRGWPIALGEGHDVVIVGGGIGLAPLRPVVLEVLARREGFGAVSLAYGSRSPSDLLFLDELHGWRSRFDFEVEVTVDRSGPGWHGDVGVVTNLLPRIPFEARYAVAMICGPEIMMKVVARELLAEGIPADRVFLSMERNMKCAVGFCGHCQYGADFLCRDGPVMSYAALVQRLRVAEL